MQSEPRDARIPVWALSLSLAATYKIEFSFFSSGYLDVSVHRVPGVWLWIHHTSHEVFSCRFPHSEICGSMDICSSPQLFAAYHVFHRLLVPRHPPCALISLTKCSAFGYLVTYALLRHIALRHLVGFVCFNSRIFYNSCLGCLVYLAFVLQTFWY